MEGEYLKTALSAAVPLWMYQFAELTFEERKEQIDKAMTDDMCLRLEYVLHKGPKQGDTARAFNDLAKSIALLAFQPGGIKIFGMHFERRPMKAGRVVCEARKRERLPKRRERL